MGALVGRGGRFLWVEMGWGQQQLWPLTPAITAPRGLSPSHRVKLPLTALSLQVMQGEQVGEGRKVLFTNRGLEMRGLRFSGANDVPGGVEARMSSGVHVYCCTLPAAFAEHVPRASPMPGPAHA